MNVIYDSLNSFYVSSYLEPVEAPYQTDPAGGWRERVLRPQTAAETRRSRAACRRTPASSSDREDNPPSYNPRRASQLRPKTLLLKERETDCEHRRRNQPVSSINGWNNSMMLFLQLHVCIWPMPLSKASYNTFKFIHSLGNNLGVIGMMQKNFSQY